MNKAITISGLLSYAWATYKSQAQSLSLFALALLVVEFGIQSIFVIPLIGWVVGIALSSIVMMGVIVAILKVVDGGKVAISDLYMHRTPFWWFLGASVLQSILIGFGSMLFVIPGVIVLVLSVFVPYIVMDQHKGPLESFKESYYLAKGVFWKILGLLILILLMNAVGVALFVVGLVVSLPVSAIALSKLYRELLSARVPMDIDTDIVETATDLRIES